MLVKDIIKFLEGEERKSFFIFENGLTIHRALDFFRNYLKRAPFVRKYSETLNHDTQVTIPVLLQGDLKIYLKLNFILFFGTFCSS